MDEDTKRQLDEQEWPEGIPDDPENIVRVLMRTPFPEDFEDPPFPGEPDEESEDNGGYDE